MDPGILIPLTLFGGAAAVLWKFFEGRHKERMAMIEKGVNPADFKSGPPFRLWQGSVLSNLKWGLLFTFVGAGLIIGMQLHYYLGSGIIDEGPSIFGSMLITGGLALILFYIIAARKMKNKSVDEP